MTVQAGRWAANTLPEAADSLRRSAGAASALPEAGPAERGTPDRSPTSGTSHRVLRNSTLNLFGQGLYAVFHLVVIVALARGLGKELFGTYYTLFALILVVQIIMEMGTATVLTRRLVQGPAAWHETLAEGAGIFGLIALGSAVLLLALGGAWAWLRGEPQALLPCALAGVACAGIQVQRYCGGVFHALEQFAYENVAKVLQVVLFAILAVLVVSPSPAGLEKVLAVFAASHVVAALYLLASLQRRGHGLGWRLTPAGVRNWLAESVPLGLGDVVRGLTWQLDTLLLGLLQPAAVVGIYSVAYRPLGPINWLPRAVLQAAFPSFARMAREGGDGLDRGFSASVRLLWLVSLPIAVAICVCAEPIIRLLAGPDYLEAARPMRLLIWITSLSFLSFQYRYLLAALGRLPLYVRLVVPVLLVEAAIEVALIPWWSYFGACAGSLVGEFLFTAVGLALCCRLGIRRIDWWAMVRATPAAAVMGILLWAIRGAALPLLAGAVVLSTGLYFALCVLLGALRRDELRHFAEALGSALKGKRKREVVPNGC